MKINIEKLKKTVEQEEAMKRIKYLASKRLYPDAIKLLNKYLESYPEDYYMIAYKITLLFKINENEAAEQLAAEVLKSSMIDNKSKEFIYETLAIAETAENNYVIAVEYWKICNELLAPELYSKGICNLALLYSYMGMLDEALEEAAPRENFNPLILNVTRARILYENERYVEALEELERETTETERESAKTKAEAQMYHLRGLIYEKIAEQENSKRRVEIQKEALELHKKTRQMIGDKHKVYWDALLHSAIINYSLGKYTESKSMCNNILKSCSNERVLDGAISLLAGDYIKNFSFDEAEKVYDRHPNEFRMALGYARVAMARHDFENAYKIVSSISTLDADIIYTKNCYMAQLMFRKNDYKEFLKYYQLIILSKKGDRNISSINDIKKMLLILEKVNNLPFTRVPKSYHEKQITSYNESFAIENNVSCRDDLLEKECFSPDTDIAKLYSDVKDYLHDDRRLCDGIYDKYIVDMSEIGEIKDNLRFVTVVCVANTKDILKIYPSNNYVGIFVSSDTVKPVQKTRLSAIEKFNKKYGL